MHDIYLQAAEFKQVTIKQMKNNALVETRQDYSANCTLCEKIITMELEHNCIVGYGLGQIHPEMKPEALVNEVFWEIPEAVQQQDKAHHKERYFQNKNEWTQEELDKLFDNYEPLITSVSSRITPPNLDF